MLKIALVAPPWFTVPPKGYGGIEWVVHHLAEGLVDRGHDVTLFASAGSVSKARIVSYFDVPPAASLGDPIIEAQHLVDALDRWREFDLIHTHCSLGPIAAAAVPAPTVHTLHGPVDEGLARFLAQLRNRLHLVAISESQAAGVPEVCHKTVIYNAIDTAAFPFGETPDDYLLFVGRMNPDKGIIEAMEIARRAQKPLMVIAKVNERDEREYFDDVVCPAMRGRDDIELLDQPPHDVKVRAYANALATLFPIRWPEPFGLVMTESMAAGTPVIAFRVGAVPEVVVDGVTGFIRDDVEGAVEAISRIGEIDRAACRNHVEEHFSARLSVARHEAFYRAILEGMQPEPTLPTLALAPASLTSLSA